MDYNILINVKIKSVIQTHYELKQQDYGQKIIVTAEDYDINGTTARLFINKNDGTVNERIMTKENDSYTYTLDADDTSCPGQTVFDVKYYKQGVRDSSASFIFNIISDRFGKLIESKDFSDSLQKKLDDCDRTIEIISEYDEKIIEINTASARAESATTNSSLVINNCEQATNKANAAADRANTAAATCEGIGENKTGINDNAIGASTTWSSNKINTSLGNQIATVTGSYLNLVNTYNGGLLFKELQGKSVQNGTPSSNVKVDIVSVGDDGSVVARVTGKNWLNLKNGTYVSAGVTATVKDGIIGVTGTASANSLIEIPFAANLNGNYTLSANNLVSYTVNELIRLKTNSDSLGIVSLDKPNAKGTFSASNTSIVSLVVRTNNGSTVNYTLKPQLELGSPTAYEQYKEQLVTIPLTQPLRGVGSVCDRGCVKVNSLWGNERKFAVEIFDGSSDENWFAESTVTTNFYRIRSSKVRTLAKKVGDIYSVANLMCDRYSAVSPSATYEKKRGISISTDGSLLVYDDAYATSNASLFTTNLATNPIVLVYELEIPVFEPYSQNLQDTLNALRSNQGETNVFTTDPQQPIISVSYGKTDTSALTLYANNIYDSKLDKSKSANNGLITEEGFYLDARYGKTLKDGLDVVNNNLNTNKTLITPLNNWTNNAVAFYAQKIGNRVFLGGMLNVGTITKGTTLAILPVGFRPAYLEVVSVSITSGTTGNTQLNLLSDGTIWIESVPSGALTISVNNISFAVN